MLRPTSGVHILVGESQAANTIRRLIDKAARNRLPVLLLGESGTGKEVVARAIHESNPQGQFVPIDCGSLVGTLMESDLFGHVKGAFSGAVENKRGLVEMADGGTAFFDEIGDLPLEMQVKLLRLIQEAEYRPVGALNWRKVDLRIIAATHRDLKSEVAAGRFRLDLYYRLNVFSMRLPPLRQRKDDIPLLVEYFQDQCRLKGLPALPLSDEIMTLFQGYEWPGNVRELKHCIDRMSAMYSEHTPLMAELPSALQYQRSASTLEQLSGALAAPVPVGDLPSWQLTPPSPVISIPESERQTIGRALAATGGERGKAARMLGIGRTTLYRKMKQYGME
jgi:transcriptional regulator with GAF, ATPase, and Fis domain